jgi:hypothetical protein
MIGAFYQPQRVICDLDLLKTLPARELSAGLAEIIKYGPIADMDFFSWIESHIDALRAADSLALAHAVERSCEIKARVVGQDEREAGLRAILNFGQTFGHAIESGMGYGAWLHEAAWGRDDRPVETESEPVSMSRETTFERDLHAIRDREELGAVFTRLCEQVAADLQRKGYEGKTIGIKLRYDNFQAVTRDQTLTEYTADAKRIRHVAGQCLKRVDLSRRLRLLGVRVGSLVKAGTAPNEVASYSEPIAKPPLRVNDHGQTELLFPLD